MYCVKYTTEEIRNKTKEGTMTYEKRMKEDYINQRKCNLIATGVENKTTAIWQILLEDRTFNNMVIKECNSNNHYLDSIKILSKYANNNLI